LHSKQKSSTYLEEWSKVVKASQDKLDSIFHPIDLGVMSGALELDGVDINGND
jgi:hypothetical protein